MSLCVCKCMRLCVYTLKRVCMNVCWCEFVCEFEHIKLSVCHCGRVLAFDCVCVCVWSYAPVKISCVSVTMITCEPLCESESLRVGCVSLYECDYKCVIVFGGVCACVSMWICVYEYACIWGYLPEYGYEFVSVYEGECVCVHVHSHTCASVNVECLCERCLYVWVYKYVSMWV